MKMGANGISEWWYYLPWGGKLASVCLDKALHFFIVLHNTISSMVIHISCDNSLSKVYVWGLCGHKISQTPGCCCSGCGGNLVTPEYSWHFCLSVECQPHRAYQQWGGWGVLNWAVTYLHTGVIIMQQNKPHKTVLWFLCCPRALRCCSCSAHHIEAISSPCCSCRAQVKSTARLRTPGEQRNKHDTVNELFIMTCSFSSLQSYFRSKYCTTLLHKGSRQYFFCNTL